MTEFKVGDRVRHTEYDETGEVTVVLPRCPVQQNDGCLSVRVRDRSRHWLNRSVRLVTPDWIGPALTPEEEGVRSTITAREPELLPAFERAVAERGLKTSPFEYKVVALFTEAADLLLRKHAMYSAKNVSQSPGGALNGLRVRIWDKTARLNNIIDKNLQGKEEFESLEDTFVDLMNYSAIAVMVLRGDWPDE